MRWIDRLIGAALAAGLWAVVGVQLLGSPAQAVSVDDIIEEAVNEVERRCEPQGQVWIWDEEWGQIQGGSLDC